jgi:asparagine synthase (glutamine-hydrolysing)
LIAIYGIFNFDGAQVDEKQMVAMREAILGPESLAPDIWRHDSGAFGVCHYGQGTEELANSRPLSKTGGDQKLALVSCARLDNREELADLLEVSREDLSGTTNDELMLLSYERWGEDCPAYLLGDFVFVIWDGLKKSLVFARDHVGIKPLFYYRDGSRIAFSSEYRALFDNRYVPKDISDEAVAIYLRYGELYHPRLTFLSAIEKLPPATTMTVSAAGIKEHIYWRPEDARPLALESLDDYAERLRELLENAVQVRLGDDAVVGSHLSGGLDSSSISEIAASKLHSQHRTLHAFCWFAPPSGEAESDEGLMVAQGLADKLKFELHCTSFGTQDMSDILMNHNLAGHDNVDVWYEHTVRKNAASLGISRILSGWGGDQFITNHGAMRYLETFWQGAIVETLLDLYRATYGKKFRLLHFFKFSFQELVIRPLPSWFPGGRKRLPDINYLRAAKPDFAKYSRQVARSVQPESWSVRGDQLAQYHSGHLQNRLESWAVAGQGAGVEYCYPLLDKRLIEFALGVPAYLYRRRGVSRFLFRYAIKDVLSREIWGSNLKPEPLRAELIIENARGALEIWRRKNTTISTNSPYIDCDRLARLLDEVLADSSVMRPRSVFKLLTVLKSILILNIKSA